MLRIMYQSATKPLFVDAGAFAFVELYPEPFPLAIASLLQSLYDSGLLTPTVTSHLPPLSDADLEVMVRYLRTKVLTTNL
ncbi:hypothetical protein LC613_37040 [Nostoc sphaeroides CHAB 2801]|uniref:hypothetical protein n=2 Tax=Nostoc sphaeroides TaxID=446679 RepID=UPI001E46D9B3|nr:hypothetical protein [Nostoc sphaeroides]MCC5633123.1 hypothetical protein [Nostoc sphaeroides CHAB 2801]